MSTDQYNNTNGESSDARSMLKSVIGAGKAAVKKIGQEEIQHFIEQQDDVEGTVTISNVRGGGDVGASSGIVLFTASYTSNGQKISRDLVLRHAPASESRLFFEYDMAHQFRVQQAMFKQGLAVPEPLWLDADGGQLGVAGYIMQLIEGTAPNPSAFAIGPLAEASEADRKSMLNQIMKSLVKIHQTDLKTTGMDDFVMNADGHSPTEKCINWYWRTWEWIKIDDYDRLVPIHQWLIDNMPAGEPELTHGDSTLHNYMFRDNELVAVIDWEMSCLGRAEMDLALQCVGNQMFAAPKESGALQPPSDEEWIAMYRAAGGRPIEHFDYYKKLAAYMVVVAIGALQRNLSDEDRVKQEPLLRGFWNIIEA